MRGAILALAVALGACGSGPTDPGIDPTPFDFSFTDPVGDTTIVTDLPPTAGRAIDLIRVSGTVGPERVTLILEFAEPVAWWSDAAANSLDGFVDFDLDASPATGRPDAARDVGRNFGMGVELYLDLRDDGRGRIGLVDPVAQGFTTVPARLEGSRLTVEIPRSSLGTDDGEFLLGVLIADPARILSDLGPDTGNYPVVRP